MKKNAKATLVKTNRQLARQWHPTKNAPLTPKDVTAGSGKKVWWKCGKGHEWEADICSRTGGTGCPYCSSRAVCKDNCLRTVNPRLAREWHPVKNSPLTPKDVVPGCNKRAWWLCREGHEWEALISNRNVGSGCPYCAGQRATAENCLQVARPDLAREWHPRKNGPVSPKNVQPGSNKKIWWLCGKGHEWKTTVAHRSAGRGCPYCAGKKAADENCLGTVHPAIAKEWHPSKNAPLTPRDVTYGTDKKFWWLCGNGHEWHTTVLGRHQGRGCPYCSGRRPLKENNLETNGPWLAREWHPTKNGWWMPKDVAYYSQKQIWWKCGKGHESREAIRSRYKRGGCPVCSLKRAGCMGDTGQ